MMMDNNQNMGGMCKCGHHKMVSWLAVLFGLVFLLAPGALNVLSQSTVNIVWPIIVIVLGFGKMCKCCSHSMLK